jgi:hypothetical protein
LPRTACDRIFWQVTQGTTLRESQTSPGPDSPDVQWIYADWTSGSNRYYWVGAAYDTVNPFHYSWYLTYQDSYYSYCSEEAFYVYIYNP